MGAGEKKRMKQRPSSRPSPTGPQPLRPLSPARPPPPALARAPTPSPVQAGPCSVEGVGMCMSVCVPTRTPPFTNPMPQAPPERWWKNSSARSRGSGCRQAICISCSSSPRAGCPPASTASACWKSWLARGRLWPSSRRSAAPRAAASTLPSGLSPAACSLATSCSCHCSTSRYEASGRPAREAEASRISRLAVAGSRGAPGAGNGAKRTTATWLTAQQARPTSREPLTTACALLTCTTAPTRSPIPILDERTKGEKGRGWYGGDWMV